MFQGILRYSSYSPEDALIPRFPPNPQTVTKEFWGDCNRSCLLFIVNLWKALCFFLALTSLNEHYDMTMTNSLHKTTLGFVRNLSFFCDSTLYAQMLHECIWPYLIGWGLVQWRCVCSLGLSAVSTQMMSHLVFCVQGQTLQEQKPCWTPYWNKELF